MFQDSRSNVESLAPFCGVRTCENRTDMFGTQPLCTEHMIEAWRWVEARPGLRPVGFEPPALRPMPTPAQVLGVVYYIRRPDDMVKVGTSRNLPLRTQSLKAAWPDDVLAAEWGGRPLERQRHAEFADERRYRGSEKSELFVASPRLLAHIEATRSTHGDPVEIAQAQRDANHRLQRRASDAGRS